MRYFSSAVFFLSSLFIGAGCTSSTGGNTDECYSPTQNLDIAYEAGAVGCTCNAGAEAQCLPDSGGRNVALVCESGRWQAVEDGPCEPAVTTECYSPTQNLDIAYKPGAVGCTCDAGAEAQCLPNSQGRDVGLVCEGGRWQAVEDGPCGL